MKLPVHLSGVIALMFGSISLQAATFTVADGDTAAIVAAINESNTNGQNDTINLAANSSYVVTTVNNSSALGANGLPIIKGDNGHSLTINGNGSSLNRNTATGTPLFRFLYVDGGTDVRIAGLTFKGGKLDGALKWDCNGGAILNRGRLALKHCTFANNETNTTYTGGGTGGAIHNETGIQGSLEVSDCVFTANIGRSSYESGYALGGAIYNNLGPVTIANTTFDSSYVATNGTATSGGQAAGGAIYNVAGVMLVRNSTFTLNVARDVGGAIVNIPSDAIGGGGSLTVVNCTFDGNVAVDTGGAIYNFGKASITSSTLAGNGVFSSSGRGGGLDSQAAVTIHNTIIAGNTINNTKAPTADVYCPSIKSQGHNLIGIADGSGPWTSSDLTGTNTTPLDARLVALAKNGGPTKTRALQSDSPALDAGDNAILEAPANITTDQRLFTRKAGTAVDIGAFEYGAVPRLRGDFNGDGFTDFLLFYSSNRTTAIWNLQGNVFLAGHYGPTLPAGWAVVGLSDIDLDGGQDYVLFNSSTRRTAIWFLQNATLVAAAFGPTLPSDWTLIAAADFDRDAQPDYLLFNPRTRRTAVWFLKGTMFTSSAYGPTLPSDWILADTVEFNSASRVNSPDYLLFNPTTQQTAIWYLNSMALSSSAYGPTLPSGWALAGAAEFNSNAKPDLVLFQASTRKTAIWYLNGASFVSGVYGPTLPSGFTLAAP